MPGYNYFWSLLKIAPWVWGVLFVVWLFVIVCYFFSFEVQASGSVLVCGALIAEVIYERLDCRKVNCDYFGYIELSTVLDSGIIYIWDEALVVKGNLEGLLSLAKDDEIETVKLGSAKWNYKMAVSRADMFVLFAIVLTAVAGTALWGYGFLIIE